MGVVDEGVQYTHPDLAANMWTNAAEAGGVPGADDDGNGALPLLCPWLGPLSVGAAWHAAGDAPVEPARAMAPAHCSCACPNRCHSPAASLAKQAMWMMCTATVSPPACFVAVAPLCAAPNTHSPTRRAPCPAALGSAFVATTAAPLSPSPPHFHAALPPPPSDFYNNKGDVFTPTDGDAHGTHVSGTIGGVANNSVGVSGVCWSIKLISAKFLGPNGGEAWRSWRVACLPLMAAYRCHQLVLVYPASWLPGGHSKQLAAPATTGLRTPRLTHLRLTPAGYIAGAVQALDYLTQLKLRKGLNIVASSNSWGCGSSCE